MPEIDENTEILEDYESLPDLNSAYVTRNRPAFDGILRELSNELADEYRAKIEEKICRWATATVVRAFYDRPPARAYIQAKMLYRDGFYEAAIMVSRSIAEMICYDRLDGITHPFGTIQQVERKNFRELISWLAANDHRITTAVLDDLNSLYDLGNNYVHPKAGQNAKDDSLKAVYLIGKSVFEVYGVKSPNDMVGRAIKTPYAEYPDICGGTNFWLTGFLTPEVAIEHIQRHNPS
ncbi:MAG: hypothetical protein HYR56_05600 [Acidobacteria bacterium]|nr:hypothetical protein [Acidobacteriota bacterium]MBI3423475.1 hypothetical protein [Acidobacteriota bacterium]